MSARKPRLPAEIGPAGAELWRRMVRQYTFSEAELELLKQACRALDDLERLQNEALKGVLVAGPRGGQRLNPAIPELRQQRAAYASLIARLKIPGGEDEIDEDVGPPQESHAKRSAREHASHAANARWKRVQDEKKGER